MIQRIACAVFMSALAMGCAGQSDDEVGSEEAALKDPTTGEPGCGGKKVLVCHIPPGNPANAHEICIGAPAVAAHVKNHGDPIGPCPSTSPPPEADAGAPDSGPPPGDGVIIR